MSHRRSSRGAAAAKAAAAAAAAATAAAAMADMEEVEEEMLVRLRMRSWTSVVLCLFCGLSLVCCPELLRGGTAQVLSKV